MFEVGKYLIEFQNGNSVRNAGSKAPSDISSILRGNGFDIIHIITSERSVIKKTFELLNVSLKVLFSIKSKSLVVVQYPVFSKIGLIIFKAIFRILRLKSSTLVALIHDIKSAQLSDFDKDEEISLFNEFDCLIVHSIQMESYLRKSGCTTRCVILGLFDYLAEKTGIQIHNKSYDVAFAGNLKKEFLDHLSELDRRIVFRIYGEPRNPAIETDNVIYSGSFSPEDLSSISAGWGLVWDGYSVESNTGRAGFYQTINSPHKASMYIAAGLPIIVSSDAAIASIVKSNGLGVLVDSLHDLYDVLSGVTEDEYQNILKNVKAYSSRLMRGQNLLDAISMV